MSDKNKIRFTNAPDNTTMPPMDDDDEAIKVNSRGNISPNILMMLYTRFSQESYDAHFYIKLAWWCDDKGLGNIADYFLENAKEENGHQMEFADYISDRGEELVILETPEVTYTPTDLLDLAQAFVNQQRLATQRLKAIAMAAFAEADLLTFAFIQELLEDQQEGEEAALTFQARAMLVANNPQAMLAWDSTFEDSLGEDPDTNG